MVKAAPSSIMAPTAVNEASSASLLSIFHEDILLCILGFVADVPFEVGDASGAGEFL
jgi:hypothetical protein